MNKLASYPTYTYKLYYVSRGQKRPKQKGEPEVCEILH